MQHRQPAGKAGAESCDRLRRQRDLRHKNEPLPAGGEHLGQQREVDLRLSTGRHPMHQKHLALAAVQGDGDPFFCRLLRRLELDAPRGRGPGCLAEDATLPAALDRSSDHGADARGHDRANHFVQWRHVVPGDQSRELDQHRREHRLGINQRLDRLQLEHRRRRVQGVDEAGHRSSSERDPHPVTDLDHAGQIVGHGVIEQAADAADASLHGHLRYRAQPGISRRGCERHR